MQRSSHDGRRGTGGVQESFFRRLSQREEILSMSEDEGDQMRNRDDDDSVELKSSSSRLQNNSHKYFDTIRNAVPSESSDESSEGGNSLDAQNHSIQGNKRITGLSKSSLPEIAIKDYSHLEGKVSHDVKEVFKYIREYKPNIVQIKTVLKPFLPDYELVIGQIDDFIKIPRPKPTGDIKADEEATKKAKEIFGENSQNLPEDFGGLGLTILDEPCLHQSDPTLLELHLRAQAKLGRSADSGSTVATIENAHLPASKEDLEHWISSMKDLHLAKPPSKIEYTRNMPRIETLAKSWPETMRQALDKKQLEIPDISTLDLKLEELLQIVCALFNIPFQEDQFLECLHLLLTLYFECSSKEVSIYYINFLVFLFLCKLCSHTKRSPILCLNFHRKKV